MMIDMTNKVAVKESEIMAPSEVNETTTFET